MQNNSCRQESGQFLLLSLPVVHAAILSSRCPVFNIRMVCVGKMAVFSTQMHSQPNKCFGGRVLGPPVLSTAAKQGEFEGSFENMHSFPPIRM